MNLPTLSDLVAVASDGEDLLRTLDRIFGFQHTLSGLTAKVTVGRSVTAGFHAEGVILRNDIAVGDFMRVVERRDDAWVARHLELDLDPDVRRRRFGSDYLRHLESWYRANAVQRIELRADMESGGYVWARLGFDWDLAKPDTAADLHLIAARLRRRAQRDKDHAALAVANLLDDPDLAERGLVPTPRQVTALGTIGRDTLLGATWNGVKHLR